MSSEPDKSCKNTQPRWQQLLHLSKGRESSLKGQLRRSLVTAILDGDIPIRRPLPSSRGLASQLGVARNTVVHVYQHLLDDGYLIAEQRRGYFVNPDLVTSRVFPIPEPINCDGGKPNWSDRLTTRFSGSSDLDSASQDWRGFEYAFVSGQIDMAQFPTNEWRECSRRSLETHCVTQWASDSLDSDDPLLLEQIQRHLLPRRGVWVSKDQILVTIGSQNALYLLAMLLVNSGDRVGFEEPGHRDVRSILKLHHCDVLPLPVDENGLMVDDRINECGVVYSTPNHQLPTDATLLLERRQELLCRAGKHDILIIEDESELNYSGSSSPALKSLDTSDRVIFVDSLSKTLAPGVRLGYIVGPAALINEVRALRRLLLCHPPINNQNTAAHFIASGYHDSLVHRLSLDYRERWETMNAALKKHLPDSGGGFAFGGNAFWLRLPKYVDANEAALVAADNGILVVPGDACLNKPSAQTAYLRLGFSSIPVDNIAAGIAKLAMLINELARTSSNCFDEEAKIQATSDV